MSMDWTYPENSGESGIFEIGRRLSEALGRVPDVTRFLYDAREMLNTTREIEKAARGNRLFTGFQTSAKLEAEASRYVALLKADTKITVFAVGPKPSDKGLKGLKYRQVPPALRELANQWFLLTDGPEALAFISYEIGDSKRFGRGGAATRGKKFVGFVTDDKAVVRLLFKDLSRVPTVPPTTPPPPRRSSASVRSLVTALSRSQTTKEEVEPGNILVAIGRGKDRKAFLRGAILARSKKRTLVLIDRGAEGFMGPHGDLRGDDAFRPPRDGLIDDWMARREGRNSLADYLEAARLAGIKAGGWFPTRTGGDGIREATRIFVGSVLMLPAEAAKPGLAERLRGMSTDQLKKTLPCKVVVVK